LAGLGNNAIAKDNIFRFRKILNFVGIIALTSGSQLGYRRTQGFRGEVLGMPPNTEKG